MARSANVRLGRSGAFAHDGDTNSVVPLSSLSVPVRSAPAMKRNSLLLRYALTDRFNNTP